MSPLKKRFVLAAAVLAAMGIAFAGTPSWVGQMGYMGQPPGVQPSPQRQNIPSGVTTAHGCVPIDQGGGCWATYNGNLASSADIRALAQQVYDFQQQMAQDISWLGYYTARSIRDNGTGRTIAKLQDATEMPAIMPCGADSCTAQANVASDTAGATGAFGNQNPISGVPMVEKQVKQGLLAKRNISFLYSSYAVHAEDFCSQSEIAAGMCGKDAKVSPVPNRDIEGISLLGGNGTQAPKHPTLDAAAREAFIQNITNQIPVPALNKAAYDSPDGQLAVGAKLQYQADQSLAQTALDQIAALHEPVQGLGTILNKTIQGLNMPAAPANISLLQYLSYMEKAQYGNPAFYRNVAEQTSPTSLLREVVLFQSQEMLYQYIAMRMRMAQDAMLASQYSTQAQANYAKIAEHYDNATSYGEK